MLSRSLWRGVGDDDGDGGAARRPCCGRALPAVAEFVFLNLDEAYVRYSRAAATAQRERKARGVYSCCRSGRYHVNCCHRNNRRAASRWHDEGEFLVDDDGYTFYRGYCADFDAVYREREATTTSPRAVPGPRPPAPAVWTKGIRDLFPEDGLGPEGGIAAAARSENPRAPPRDARTSLEIESAASGPGDADVGSAGEQGPAVGARDDETDLARPLLANSDAAQACESGAQEESSPPYPYRLQHFFLPPGFHTWGNVLQFLQYFFFVPAIVELFRRIPTPVSARSRGDHRERGGGRRSSVPIGNLGRDLTDGEQELLRCAGLDTYLLVRDLNG